MKAPKAETKPKELVPEGNHIGRLYGITYIGTVDSGYLIDIDHPELGPKQQFKVRLTWELPNELRKFEKDGEEKELPMSISREVTFSLYKGKQTAILRSIAHALLGKSLTDEEAEDFDIDNLLGKACMIEVSHETIESSGRKFAKAVGFGSIPSGMTVPDAVNEIRVHNINEMTKDQVEEMPEFIRDKMKSSNEYQRRFSEDKGGTGEAELSPEDIPF